MRRRIFRHAPHHIFAAGALLLLPLLGCSGSDPLGVKPVTGRLTYKGAPVDGALVMFRPKGGDHRVASGSTREDGSFELATSGATRGGAMPGEYDVLVSKVVEVDAQGNPVRYDPAAYNPAAASQKRTTPKSMVPEKYNNPRKPLLSATVGDGDNAFTFDLTD